MIAHKRGRDRRAAQRLLPAKLHAPFEERQHVIARGMVALPDSIKRSVKVVFDAPELDLVARLARFQPRVAGARIPGGLLTLPGLITRTLPSR